MSLFFTLLTLAGTLFAGANCGSAVYDRRYGMAALHGLLAIVNAIGFGAWTYLIIVGGA